MLPDRNINVRVDVCDQYERDILPPLIALVAPSPSSAWPWTGIADSWQGTGVASAEKRDSSWALTNIQVGLSAGIFFFFDLLCYVMIGFVMILNSRKEYLVSHVAKP